MENGIARTFYLRTTVPVSSKPINTQTRIKEEERLRSLFRPNDIHQGWRALKAPFQDDHSPTLFEIPADNPVGILTFVMGKESSPLYYAETLNAFRDQGFHIFAKALLNRRQCSNYVSKNFQRTEWFTLDPDSPINLFQKETGLENFLCAHSAGALKVSSLLLDPNKREQAAEKFAHYFKLAPFFGSAYSSKILDTENYTLATRFAARAGHHLFRTVSSLSPKTPLGRSFHDQLGVYLPNPNGEEAMLLGDISDEFLREKSRIVSSQADGHNPFALLPSTTIIDDKNDIASSTHRAALEARLSGSRIVRAEGAGHNVFNDPAIVPYMISHMLRIVKECDPLTDALERMKKINRSDPYDPAYSSPFQEDQKWWQNKEGPPSYAHPEAITYP